MDIQKEREAFEEWFDNVYDVNNRSSLHAQEFAWIVWQAQAAQTVPENKKFNLNEFLEMEKKLDSKDGVIKADLDRFIAYAEMVLEKAKAFKEPK